MIQRLQQIWGKYHLLLQIAFVASMLAFVGVAATSFFKTVDWGQVNLTLHQQSPRTLLLLTLGGIIAVIPMLGYDFTLNRLLQANYHPSYLIRCGG